MSENSFSISFPSSLQRNLCSVFTFLSMIASAETLSAIIFPHSFDVVLYKQRQQMIASVYKDVFFICVVLDLVDVDGKRNYTGENSIIVYRNAGSITF